ncbi:hypothetical protein [Candidatus Tisiphia endosymbiont of Temnostethus pusillus]|uniref:hypothetical protein n=1 Tax=Candidatus Tisiphia endosymbiont of Temnostethus pusillus TaxID=3139335 RepID=UPI0035C91BCD
MPFPIQRLQTDRGMEEIQEALRVGKTKASICRNFGIKRSTLYDTLNRLTTNN